MGGSKWDREGRGGEREREREREREGDRERDGVVWGGKLCVGGVTGLEASVVRQVQGGRRRPFPFSLCDPCFVLPWAD